jgi:hypothetical protein
VPVLKDIFFSNLICKNRILSGPLTPALPPLGAGAFVMGLYFDAGAKPDYSPFHSRLDHLDLYCDAQYPPGASIGAAEGIAKRGVWGHQPPSIKK